MIDRQKPEKGYSSYEEAQKEHMKEHREKIQRAGYKIIKEREFNRNDRSQQFYKVYERQFRSSLMMKHGYKVTPLEIEEEDLAIFCFSLLQAEAKFPVKIFTVDHPSSKHVLDPEQTSRKDMWMETQILVSGLTSTSIDETTFETKIYQFFKEYLVVLLRDFMKRRINWDYMVTKEYTDEKVIKEFQSEIIEPANRKFSQLFN